MLRAPRFWISKASGIGRTLGPITLKRLARNLGPITARPERLESSIVANHVPKTKLLYQTLKGMVGGSKKLSNNWENSICYVRIRS